MPEALKKASVARQHRKKEDTKAGEKDDRRIKAAVVRHRRK